MEFILERSPLAVGFYERLVHVIKNCLKKVVGKAKLNFKELTQLLPKLKNALMHDLFIFMCKMTYFMLH